VSTISIPGKVARPLLASIFITGGLDAPEGTGTLVRTTGAAQVVAGTMLSFGVLRRSTALLVIGSLVPTTVAGHRFWEELDEQARARRPSTS
jgi:putative oxidoreductase